MLPDKTYILRITRADSFEIEEVEHTNREDAEWHLRQFRAQDADIYSRIELVEHDWDTRTERTLSILLLTASESGRDTN